MPNFSIALTGLQADSVALNSIGNNLANLNTTAYKKQSTTFEDLFYQTLGGSGSGDTLQAGVGTRVSSTTSNWSQGSLQTTSNSTDMALNGSGYFLVNSGGSERLTRAGNFQLDAHGNLTTTAGDAVLGYGVQNGAVNVSGTVEALQLPIFVKEPAQATTAVSMTTSLDASAAAGTSFSSPVTLYDSLGTSHAATVTYTKTSASTWDYSFALPAGDATGTPVKNTGTLSFDASGKLVSPASNVQGITFPGMVDGAKDLAFTFNLYGTDGGATLNQTAGTSNTSSTTQDGFAAGAYQSFSVDSNGTITVAFSNGHSAVVGQVAVATVANDDGLVRAGQNEYIATRASGEISVGIAGANGHGALEDESLEQSNVDISAEFSDLIVAQRAFEANSKTVTTFDTVTQEAIGMIR